MKARPCKLIYRSLGEGKSKLSEEDHYFHKWHTDKGNLLAIIENPFGNVILVPFENIKFNEKPKEL